MRPSTISLYEKAIDNFKQNLEYLKWKVPFSLISKSYEVYDLTKQMEGNTLFCATSGLFREIVAASYLIAMEDDLLLASPLEFAEDISTYTGLTTKEVLILGNNPPQFITEILLPFFESFLVTYQMASRLIHFIATQIKIEEKHELLKALTLTDFLIPTLRKIQDILQTTDIRLAAVLMQVGITGFLNQHTRILEGKPLRANTIGKAYQMAVEEYPPMEGEDIFFDISWRLVLTKTWLLIVNHLARETNHIPNSQSSKKFKESSSLL